MAIAKVDNKYIYYEQYGKGEDLILISGFTADHTVWMEMIGSLSTRFRVTIFDNPGVGQSYVPQSNNTLEKMSNDISEFLDYLKITNAYFIGSSMGGALTIQLCLDQPNRVKKAILCGTTAVIPITAKLQIEGLKLAYENNYSLDFILLYIMPWLFGRNFLNDKRKVETFKKLAIETKNPQTFEGFLTQAKVLLDYDISSRLKDIKTECLIVASEEDLLIPMYCSNFLREHIPNSKFELIGDGIGHMFHLEAPQKLSELALKFLKGSA